MFIDSANTNVPEGLPWWQSDDPGPILWQHVKFIEGKQLSHHRRLLYNALRYSNRELSAFDWGWGRTVTASMVPYRDTTENLHLSVVDTMVSEIGKNKVKARPQTKNASFKLYRAAKKLDRYLYGEAVRLNFWEIAKGAFHDACWGEVGVVYGEWGPDGVCLERVFPDEFVVDNDSCQAETRPPEVFRRKAVHVESVIAKWKLPEDKAERLREEARKDERWLVDRRPGPGWIIVTEGHRLAFGGEPGRHVIGTYSTTIWEEEWKHPWFPYRWFHWMRPLSGFFCPSAVEQVDPYQKRLDEINSVIRDAQDLMARPRIWVPLGSKIQTTAFDNRIGRVITSAVKPEPMTWSAASPELYQERDRLVRTCFEYFGLTQLAAQGKLPQSARLDSSEALREYNTIQDNRLADLAQRYEEFQKDLYHLIIDLSEAAHAEGHSLKTTWVGGRRVEEVNWKDVDFSKDRYVIQVEASSTMPETPAARMDYAVKLASSGMLSREELLLVMKSGDVDKQVSLLIAEVEDIDNTIDELESGRFRPPSGIQGLVRGVPRVRARALQLRCEYPDIDKSILADFELWVIHATWLMDNASSAPTQAPGNPMGMPQAPGPQGPPIPGPQAGMPPGPMPPM